MPIGDRETFVIDVGKRELIVAANTQLGRLHRRCREHRDEEKTLRRAEYRA
jgi:hypothetical protein